MVEHRAGDVEASKLDACNKGAETNKMWANAPWLDVYITVVTMLQFISNAVILETVRFVMSNVQQRSEDLASFKVGFVGSAVPAGALCGVLIGGLLADSIGRRTVVVLGELQLIIVSLAILVPVDGPGYDFGIDLLIFTHLLKGFCFGMIIACTMPWAVERLSTLERGILISVANMGWVVGALITMGLLKVGILSTNTRLELFTLVTASAALVAMFTASESKQWQHAVAARDSPSLLAGLLDMPAALVLKLMIFWFTMPGVSYALFFWAPTLLREHAGVETLDMATLSIAIIASVPCGIWAGWAIDYGRRRIIATSLIIVAGLLFVMPFSGVLSWKVCYILLECAIGCAWMVASIWTNELFPTRVRATAFGCMQCCARISAMIGPVLAGLIRDWSPSYGLYWLCGMVAVLSVLPVMLLDETAKSLPHLDSEETAKISQHLD